MNNSNGKIITWKWNSEELEFLWENSIAPDIFVSPDNLNVKSKIAKEHIVTKQASMLTWVDAIVNGFNDYSL